MTVILWKSEYANAYFTADEVVGYGYPPRCPQWVQDHPGAGLALAPTLTPEEFSVEDAETTIAAQVAATQE